MHHITFPTRIYPFTYAHVIVFELTKTLENIRFMMETIQTIRGTDPHPNFTAVGGPDRENRASHLCLPERGCIGWISRISVHDVYQRTTDDVARLNRIFSRKKTVLRRTVKTLHGAALESLNHRVRHPGQSRNHRRGQEPRPHGIRKKEGLPTLPQTSPTTTTMNPLRESRRWQCPVCHIAVSGNTTGGLPRL